MVNRGSSTEPAATVTDVLPAEVAVTGVTTTQGSCTTGASVVCDLGSLAVGATAIVNIDGSVAAGSGQITNVATVAGVNLDPFPNNNVATDVTALNNSPNAVDQSVATPAATPIVVDVLLGATDPDGDAVVVTAAGPATSGSVVVNSDGTVTYTPNVGFKGVDTFPFTVTDGRGGFDTAIVTVTVANAPPVAVDDAAATPPATAVTIPVLANDSDPNGDALTVTAVTQPAGGVATGVVTLNADGTVTFLPDPTFRGIATFTYTVSDGTDSVVATVTVEVPDQAPAAVDDFAVTPSGTAVTVPVLANDVDPNGDTLSVVAGSLSVPANGGAVQLNGDGTVTYTPLAGFKGVDTFTYDVTDGLLTSTATVFVTVLNAPPVAMDDDVTTAPDTPIDIAVLADDSDPNGDVLTVIGVTPPGNGSVVVNADGTVTYTPNPGFKGTDTFIYTITDGTDMASATVTVIVPNNPPNAANDARTTESGVAVTVPVLANDSDPNGDVLTVIGVGAPSNGVVVVNADGTVTYTPDPGFSGVDTFTYTVSDGTDTATGDRDDHRCQWSAGCG